MLLEEAVDGLYRAFARYPRRAAIEVCPHCVGREDQDTLARLPLRSLSCAQLSRFGFKAMTTWGTPDDYKHFLPRILELASTPEAADWPGLDMQLIASKLQLAGCASWASPELAALRDFISALRETILAHDVDGHDGEVYDALDSLTAAASPRRTLIEPGDDAL
jgi:hypothetical protein